MHSTDNITISNNQITYNDNGEPVNNVSNLNVLCYADFSNNSLKFQKDGETIVAKIVFFITQKVEIAKLQSIQKSNMQNFEVEYKNEKYNMLNIEHGLQHIQIYV